MVNQCESTYQHVTKGKIRCQDVLGHTSVHYHDGIWWPNEKGLPEGGRSEHVVVLIVMSIVAIVLGGIIYWLLHR